MSSFGISGHELPTTSNWNGTGLRGSKDAKYPHIEGVAVRSRLISHHRLTTLVNLFDRPSNDVIRSTKMRWYIELVDHFRQLHS